MSHPSLQPPTMSLMTYHTLKKTYFYNFYPTRAEEEGSATATSRPPSAGPGLRYQRMLVEMRDVHPPPVLDPHHPWQIKKALNHYEIASGRIIVSFGDTFEYILRYWNLCMANHIAILGHKVAVVLWDVTSERNPRKYEGKEVYFQVTHSENYILTCMEMMRDRKLKVDDYIGLYWDSRESVFRVKLFYSSL